MMRWFIFLFLIHVAFTQQEYDYKGYYEKYRRYKKFMLALNRLRRRIDGYPSTNTTYRNRGSSYGWNRLWMKYIDSNSNYVIPYTISGPYTNDQYQTIYGVFQSIERNTCVRFKPRTNEDDYMDIQNRFGEGCWSWIGRHGGRSIVKLEASKHENCLRHHTTMHEILHGVGLRHEHVRADRDQFVTIIYQNIRPNCFYNFEKRNDHTYGLPYDYQSIMHYGKHMCQRRWGDITISAPTQHMNVIGKSLDASPYDYYKVCAMYGCTSCLGRKFDLQSVVRASRLWH